MKFGPWKIWNGGNCPVDPDTKVQVQYAKQNRRKAEADRCYVLMRASDFSGWEHTGEDYDIVAYREVIQPVRVTKIEFCQFFKDSGLRVLFLAFEDAEAKITYDLVDGKPDWSTLRAEPLEALTYRTATVWAAIKLAAQLRLEGEVVPDEVAAIAAQPLPAPSGVAFRWQNS